MPRILVIGDAMLDTYWHGAVERISPEAPVPVCRVEREEYRLGAAANVANNCATLGAEVQLICCAGEDEARGKLAAMLKTAGILPYFFTRDKTTVKLRVIGHQQQIVRCDFEDKCRGILPPIEAVEWCDIVVISDYGKGAIDDPHSIIATAAAFDKRVLVDTKATDYHHFEGAFLLKQNLPEFTLAAKGRQAEEIRRAYGMGNVLVTRGEHGMTLYDGRVTDIPSDAREVFDVTGAGDTVMAALAVFLSEGIGVADSARRSNKAAGVVVGKFGTATVTRSELVD